MRVPLNKYTIPGRTTGLCKCMLRMKTGGIYHVHECYLCYNNVPESD